MKRFEADLRANKELRQKYEEACQNIAKAGEGKSDGEVLAKTAAELGYAISVADLERSFAAAQELDSAQLAKVSGGLTEDEEGNDSYCITAWHCYTAMLHNDVDEKNIACWSNYKCLFWNH